MERPLLDPHLLQSFVAIVETGSFTRAGERMHLTQSTISQQMRRLEQQLGCPLLDRSGRQVVTTAQGETLLGLARRCRENAHLQPLLTVEQPIQFVEVNEGDATAGKMQVVAQVQEYVKNHLSEKLTLADVAAVFNFSPNYLSQLFGKYGDSGFVEYITETRIAAAKEMLEQGDLKVYEIAEKLGYESAFYFSKVFKKVTGLSPREYQQSI